MSIVMFVFEKFRGEYVRLFCEKIWTVWGLYFREFLYCLTFPKRVFELKEPVLFNQFFINFSIALPKSLQIKGGLFEGGVWVVKAKKCLKGWTMNFEKLWVTCAKSAKSFFKWSIYMVVGWTRRNYWVCVWGVSAKAFMSKP